MNGFYQHPRQYSADDLHCMADMNNHQDALMGMMGSNGMDNSGMGGGPSLEEMIHQQNEKELQRRRSFHNSHSYGSNRSMHSEDPRRSSMLEFGSPGQAELDGFQFDPTPVSSNANMQRPDNIAQRRLDSQRGKRQMSNENLALNTNYSSMPSYSSMTSSSPYGQPIGSADPMSGFDMSHDYMTNSMLMGMDFTSNAMDNASTGSVTPRDPYQQNSFASPMSNPQIPQNLAAVVSGRMHDPGGGEAPENMEGQNIAKKSPPNNMQMADQVQNPAQQPSTVPTVPMPNPMSGLPMDPTNSITPVHGLPTYDPAGKEPGNANLDLSSDANVGSFQVQKNAAQHVVPQYRNAYSSSGFDMLGVLMRVAARPKPQINIGAVDMSCAFVVCDVTQHDVPIVYCSDVFERLTAYTRHEILGRNCRFLQAPDGKIQAGVKRKYVDDQSVLRIKNMIGQRQETQISLINYRKGGQPFMNLLTMIPITWDTDEVKYYVGFQVDLVEQPTSITNKNPGKPESLID